MEKKCYVAKLGKYSGEFRSYPATSTHPAESLQEFKDRIKRIFEGTFGKFEEVEFITLYTKNP